MKIGDRVLLKGGGPILTVCDIDTYNGRLLAELRWFDDSGKLMTTHLPPEAVRPYNENDE